MPKYEPMKRRRWCTVEIDDHEHIVEDYTISTGREKSRYVQFPHNEEAIVGPPTISLTIRGEEDFAKRISSEVVFREGDGNRYNCIVSGTQIVREGSGEVKVDMDLRVQSMGATYPDTFPVTSSDIDSEAGENAAERFCEYYGALY